MSDLRKELASKLMVREATEFSSPSKKLSRYEPLDYQQFFSAVIKVTVNGNHFNTYRFLSSEIPCSLFVLHHGGGHSGASWALTAKLLYESFEGKCDIFAFDCRGHGLTETNNDGDFSLQTLSRDLSDLVKSLDQSRIKEVILVGHSLGGPVIVDAALNGGIPLLLGVCVIDVVEGTALESLSVMRSILSSRPNSFSSLNEAIKWSVSTGVIRNIESARISVPLQMKKDPNDPNGRYIWRTELMSSEPFWLGWFQDLSNKFLSVKAAKMLMLAGSERLDKELMIGSMQGKFQTVILPDVGHSIHENLPDKVAEALHDFCKRNRRLVLPPKMGITSPNASFNNKKQLQPAEREMGF